VRPPPVTAAKPRTLGTAPATISHGPVPASASSVSSSAASSAGRLGSSKTPSQASAPGASRNPAAPGTARSAAYGPGPILPSVAAGLSSGKKLAEDNYDLSDKEASSDSESDNEKPRKRIPDWARGPNLEAALHAQFGGTTIDPDLIFAPVKGSSCDLEVVFARQRERYRLRRSTGDWSKDQLTSRERHKYRKDMSFMVAAGSPATVKA